MVRHGWFFQLGRYINRFRWLIIMLWILIGVACIPFIPNLLTPFQSTGFIDEHSESAHAQEKLDQKLGFNHINQFVILYQSKSLLATSDIYRKKVHESLAALKNFPIEHTIIYPDKFPQQISKDKHTSFAVIQFKSKKVLTHQQLAAFTAAIKTPHGMRVLPGGEGIFVESINKQTQTDIYKADLIATPVSVVVLVLVFGTLIAAFIPMCLGGGCALVILTTLYFLAHAFSLSVFTLNIALLLGLCLSLDYSLFMISRFREELLHEISIEEAIARTVGSAGKAVFFSGLAVFISLSALLLFPVNILFSIGTGGLTAVFFAIGIAVFLLPAVLAVLTNAINRFAVRKQSHVYKNGIWRRLAVCVVKRPWLFFVAVLLFLLMLGYPFLKIQCGLSDYNILPKHTESRRFFDTFVQKFNENELTPILLVVTTHNRVLAAHNIAKLYDLTTKLKHNAAIERIDSIVTTSPRLSKDQYKALYKLSRDQLDPDLQKFMKTNTREHLTVISLISKYPMSSKHTKNLIKQLRNMDAGRGMTLSLTGVPVQNVDVMQAISRVFPYAVAWITVLTYLILLLLLRSIVLPLKAIFMNVLSLSASYGVLVFIFQEGHFHHFLHFEPQGMVDVSLLIIIFCAIFGFSMDYEVFLLTRIQEAYQKTKNNKLSIIFGIEKSSRIITSAAVIVICICGSFMVADVLMVKEFGLGIAVAIFVDAFVIRSILVPSTMALIKYWNWYLPKWLDRILPK